MQTHMFDRLTGELYDEQEAIRTHLGLRIAEYNAE